MKMIKNENDGWRGREDKSPGDFDRNWAAATA